MTIYEVLSDTTGDSFSSRDDIRPEVELALDDQFGEYGSQREDVLRKFKDYKSFVDKTIDILDTLDCDESWLDGEAYFMIEGVAQDILDGASIGERNKRIIDILDA